MSKPTAHNVSPYDFYNAFGFFPCSCHETPKTAIYAQYRVEYETKPFDTELKKIEVTCTGCGNWVEKDVSHMGIDGNSIGF